MSEQGKYPIDLDLWRRAKNAPESEKWKWGWDTWAPLIDTIFEDKPAISSISKGRVNFEELTCPVCDAKRIVAYFLTVSIAVDQRTQRPSYVADRWFECENCQTQVRDRGELPRWYREEDIVWASEKLRELAERKLK